MNNNEKDNNVNNQEILEESVSSITDIADGNETPPQSNREKYTGEKTRVLEIENFKNEKVVPLVYLESTVNDNEGQKASTEYGNLVSVVTQDGSNSNKYVKSILGMAINKRNAPNKSLSLHLTTHSDAASCSGALGIDGHGISEGYYGFWKGISIQESCWNHNNKKAIDEENVNGIYVKNTTGIDFSTNRAYYPCYRNRKCFQTFKTQNPDRRSAVRQVIMISAPIWAYVSLWIQIRLWFKGCKRVRKYAKKQKYSVDFCRMGRT